MSLKTNSAKNIQIGEIIRERIMSGEYGPGMKIPTERSFANEFSVSPITITKALKVLIDEGLITRLQRSGTYVSDQEKQIIPGKFIKLALLWRSYLEPQILLDQENFYRQISMGILSHFNMHTEELVWGSSPDDEFVKATWTSTKKGLQIDFISEGKKTYSGCPDFKYVDKGNYDGFISIGIINENFLNKLLALKKPTVLADFPNDDYIQNADAVYVDPFHSFKQVIEESIQQNKKNIHFIGSAISDSAPHNLVGLELHKFLVKNQISEPDSILRQSAYRAAMDTYQLPVKNSWVHQIPFGKESAKDLSKKLLNLKNENKPECIIANSLGQAEIVHDIFKSAGESIVIYACSNQLNSRKVQSRVLFINGEKIGSASASLLISKIQQPNRINLKTSVPIELDVANIQINKGV